MEHSSSKDEPSIDSLKAARQKMIRECRKVKEGLEKTEEETRDVDLTGLMEARIDLWKQEVGSFILNLFRGKHDDNEGRDKPPSRKRAA